VAFEGRFRKNKPVAKIILHDSGPPVSFELYPGDTKIIPLEKERQLAAEIIPSPGVDAGEGKGRRFRKAIRGGEVGLIFDARGRPIVFPEVPDGRIETVTKWRDCFREAKG
jgi:hypothetical protein